MSNFSHSPKKTLKKTESLSQQCLLPPDPSSRRRSSSSSSPPPPPPPPPHPPQPTPSPPSSAVTPTPPFSSPLRNVNPLTLTEAAIKIATKVALRAKAKAILLSLSPPLSPQQKSSLETCAESYGDVVDGLQNSANFLAMSSRKKADVMNYLSAASFGVTICEDAFRGVSGTKFPLARVNKTLRKYVSNALAMGDQLSLHW